MVPNYQKSTTYNRESGDKFKKNQQNKTKGVFSIYILLPLYLLFSNLKPGEEKWVKTKWSCSFRGAGQ